MTPPLNVAEQPRSEKGSLAVARWILPWLTIVAVGAVLNPWFVPGSNEWVYLAVLRTHADPSFLANDWTFTEGFTEHYVFNHVFAPLADLIGVEALAWIGRGVTLAVSAAILLWLAGTLRINRWIATGAIVVWLAVGQGFVAYSAMIDVFEANSVAMPLLVGGLVAALRGRIPLALLLAGLSFSFHPGVGLWGCIAIAFALLIEPETRRAALRWSWVGVIAALGGIIPIVTSGALSGAQDYEFLIRERMPYHLDPFYFPRRGMVAFAAMVAVVVLYGWVRRSDVRYRLTTWFTIALVATFGLGVLASVLELWRFVILFPFRLPSLFAPLVALLFIAAMLTEGAWRALGDRAKAWPERVAVGLAGVTVLWILVLMNPVVLASRTVSGILDERDRYHDELADVFRWSADEVPIDAVIVMPPWREDASYLSERAQVASWKAVIYEDSATWRERIEAQVGADLPIETGAKYDEMRTRYAALSLGDIDVLAERYGATHIISESPLPFTEVHRVGDWAVYVIEG